MEIMLKRKRKFFIHIVTNNAESLSSSHVPFDVTTQSLNTPFVRMRKSRSYIRYFLGRALLI